MQNNHKAKKLNDSEKKAAISVMQATAPWKATYRVLTWEEFHKEKELESVLTESA